MSNIVFLVKRGRPLESELAIKRTKPNSAYMPTKDVRLDQIGHWPKYGSREDGRVRCKFPGCKGITQNKCTKCNVNLCYTKDKNCFFNYHNQ